MPEQDVTGGVVRIVVAEINVGAVLARGNRRFSNALLTREMPLARGAPIGEADAGAALALLNGNPSRHVDVVYAPGSTGSSTDMELQTDERVPLLVNGGYDNAGNSAGRSGIGNRFAIC